MAIPSSVDIAVARIVHYFEHISPNTLANLNEIYSADARFKDPFNELRGVPAIREVYAHMFESLHEPRFVITGRIVQGDQCVLTWDFQFRFMRFDTTTTQTVRGASHLRLDTQGRISDHRDYWDVAEELYEKIPVLGGLMRWLKRRASQ